MFAWRSLLLVISLACVGQLADAQLEFSPCNNRYTPDEQIAMGNQSKRQISKQMPIMPDASSISQYIQKLGAKLTAYAPGYKWPYHFHVVNVDEINAFALPGGSIFVNLGTIQAAQNEAQLAGVMAHEISHVVLQHSVCNLEKEERVGLLAGLGEMAAGFGLGGTRGALAERGIGMVTNLGFLKMSRTDEKQADLEGTGILYEAGYDPHGMSEFFAIIESKYGEGSAQFLSDHPDPGNRTEYVDKEIASFAPRASYITTSPEFTTAQAQAEKKHAYTEAQVSSGAWRKQHSDQNGRRAGKNGSGNNNGTNVSAQDWRSVSGTDFSVRLPKNWIVYQRPGAAVAGPQGGIALAANGFPANVTYGMMMDTYQPSQSAQASANLNALVQEVTKDNPNVELGPQKEIYLDGVVAQTVDCRIPGGGNGQAMHYWITAFPPSNGSLRYVAFLAPATDFHELRPTFHKILQSVKLQS
jgi:beta-barrel assembly-enhancing protease